MSYANEGNPIYGQFQKKGTSAFEGKPARCYNGIGSEFEKNHGIIVIL